MRDAYYRRLTNQKPDQRVFLKGWLNRLNALRATVGLGGLEAGAEVDFGDAGYIARIPDVGVDPDFDVSTPNVH